MQKIVPAVWLNGVAEEAAQFYAQALPGARVDAVMAHPAGAEHAPLGVDLNIDGFQLTLINGGDRYAPNPSVSFMLTFDPAQMDNAEQALRETWAALMEGGQERMPLQSYDFSPLFGWCADRYGVDWQLMMPQPGSPARPSVMPALLFTSKARGKAAEAREAYIEALSAVAPSQPGVRVDYPENEGVILFSDAELAGVWTIINDSTFDHAFDFTPGISFQVLCQDQAQIDAVWQALAAEEQPCGWCTDRYGVSWQVLPENLDELLRGPGAWEKFQDMRKIQLEELRG
ncbi:VOC family protein [Corynebacterium sp.]|uniref:VOC family protein n=1 Tax=Corynebacterium sp. TaxID=1720 RepID=UPI0026DBA5A8|nr:VOC family protein [Corynebacterium sp.]MDO5031338.1 VOC family protein [Corynebacterium sp.]